MVRLLSLLIVLLVPNPFGARAPTRAVREGPVRPAAARSVRAEAAGGERARPRGDRRAGDPDTARGEPVPVLLDPGRLVVDLREHPTLEPSLGR
ncbi:MAG: hypothetical protein AAB290_05695 [Candidatus Eisenbacteria bacterium]